MRGKYRGIIGKFIAELIEELIEKLFFSVQAHADEGETRDSIGESETGDSPASHPTINYEDLIRKARKEEKDKQYNTIQRLKLQIDTMTQQHNADLLRVGELEKQLQSANEKLVAVGSGDSDEIKTLKSSIKSLESEKAELDKKVKEYEQNPPLSREDIEKEVRASLEKEYEVRTYRAEKMAELKDQILVPELVMGETKEDIDTSVAAALERSKEIRKSLGIPEPGEEPQRKRGRTPKNPANPSGGSGTEKEYSLEYLASLDVRSKEYAEVRKQLGLR